jgi:hypothetical protein
MIVASSSFSWAGPQSLTFAIPLGAFAVFCLWGFFSRRPSR